MVSRIQSSFQSEFEWYSTFLTYIFTLNFDLQAHAMNQDNMLVLFWMVNTTRTLIILKLAKYYARKIPYVFIGLIGMFGAGIVVFKMEMLPKLHKQVIHFTGVQEDQNFVMVNRARVNWIWVLLYLLHC